MQGAISASAAKRLYRPQHRSQHHSHTAQKLADFFKVFVGAFKVFVRVFKVFVIVA
jgi:hypothetical protein